MTAICPAAPPKLRSAISVQVLPASENGMGECLSGSAPVAAEMEKPLGVSTRAHLSSNENCAELGLPKRS